MPDEQELFSAGSDYETETVPVAPIGIIPLKGTDEISAVIDDFLVNWRSRRRQSEAGSLIFAPYDKESFILGYDLPRFGSGEGKGVIKSSVRGLDLYFYVDVTNYSITYKIGGTVNHYSPDDHYQDLKRLISATAGQARRVTVIMPFLYEGRMHNRRDRESLDCAQMLKELVGMGVDNVITFDANDARVMNAIPLSSFDTIMPTYQFIKALCNKYDNILMDSEHMAVISPDDSGMRRAIYMANVLGVDAGMFYNRKDYTRIVNDENPTIAVEYLGPPIQGKDVIICDDMISSGNKLLSAMRELRKRNAGRVFACVSYGLFTGGLEKFDNAYAEGLFDRIFTTNLIYRTPELLSRKWYGSVNMGKYVALLIDYLNHDDSIGALLTPTDRIRRYLTKYRERQKAKGII